MTKIYTHKSKAMSYNQHILSLAIYAIKLGESLDADDGSEMGSK
jgi:hypothetical protein